MIAGECSLLGPTQTYANTANTSAGWSKADSLCSGRVIADLTQSRLRFFVLSSAADAGFSRRVCIADVSAADYNRRAADKRTERRMKRLIQVVALILLLPHAVVGAGETTKSASAPALREEIWAI